MDVLSTQWIWPAVHAAVQLDVVEALASGPMAAADVAKATDADPVAMDRLLRALVTIGLVEYADANETYQLTSTGALLRADAPTSFRDQVLLNGTERRMQSWMQLTECIRTGGTADKAFGDVDEFGIFEGQPDAQRPYHAAMNEGTRLLADALVDAYDFSAVRSIVDVGGGYGGLLVPILRAHPDMKGIVFDRPHCRQGAEQQMEEAQLADRCRFTGGDFFEDALPPDADAYIIKSVIHDWDDDHSIAILRRCREAMRDSSRVLVVGWVMPDRPSQASLHRLMMWADLRMLVIASGRERTRSQHVELFDAANLRLSRVLPTQAASGMSVIEALPA
jgi:orsellinic acid C2-O-methyltransferase